MGWYGLSGCLKTHSLTEMAAIPSKARLQTWMTRLTLATWLMQVRWQMACWCERTRTCWRRQWSE